MPSDISIQFNLNGAHYNLGILAILIAALVIFAAGHIDMAIIARSFMLDATVERFTRGHNPRKGVTFMLLLLLAVVVIILALIYTPGTYASAVDWVQANPLLLIVLVSVAGVLFLWEGLKWLYRRFIAKNANT